MNTIEDIKKLSVIEIKAIIYDSMAMLQKMQSDVQVLQQVLAEKAKVESVQKTINTIGKPEKNKGEVALAKKKVETFVNGKTMEAK